MEGENLDFGGPFILEVLAVRVARMEGARGVRIEDVESELPTSRERS
ncbi:MAG TPA: hypothetical protein VGX00_01760 [Thermoplasmata archaeon]|nr:hypothetical protein [Thermoplasmata archaeon]